MPRSRRYLLRSWLAATSILFCAFSLALAEGSAEPSATALIEALVTRRQPVGGPFGLIDHTGFIYLVGKDGRYIDFLPPGLAPERIVEALRLHLDRQNGP